MKKGKEKIRLHKAVKGIQRKRHFESGGDVASWRGRANVFVDRKKRENKRVCRVKVIHGNDA